MINTESPRPISTVYYNHKKQPLRTNHSKHIDLAISRAVYHMQVDRYSARVAEVLDEHGNLWAIVMRSMKRGKQELTILYHKDLFIPATAR